MGVAFVSGWSAETGGIEELSTAANYPFPVTTPAPPHANETYCLRHDWKETGAVETWTMGADWYTVSTEIYFNDITPLNAIQFLYFEDGAAPALCWALRLKAGPTSGTIELLDANGDVIATSAADVVSGTTWHQFDVKCKHANSTDLQVWLDGDLLFDEAAFDASSGGTAGICYTYNGSNGDRFYVSHLIVVEDDGANINTNPTVGRTWYFRVYQNSTQGPTGDWGTVLDTGSWSDAGETPGNDGTDCRYDLPLNTTKNGGVYCDDGARTGPSGDGAIAAGDGIVGAVWTWRVANGVAAFNGRARWYGQYGKDDGPVISDTASVLIPTGTTKYNYHVAADAADAECPTKSDFLALGVKGNKGALGIAARLDTFGMWGCVLFREPRSVCIDGLITQVA